jgi:hypothetical protein
LRNNNKEIPLGGMGVTVLLTGIKKTIWLIEKVLKINEENIGLSY